MEDVDREISEMKLSLNARARIVAESYLTAVSLGRLIHDFKCGAHLSPLKSSTHSWIQRSYLSKVYFMIMNCPKLQIAMVLSPLTSVNLVSQISADNGRVKPRIGGKLYIVLNRVSTGPSNVV